MQIVEFGSIAEAARRLDLTPTAVSLRIKALEAEVGTTLIERAGRTVRPTLAGGKVIEQARLILGEVKTFNSLASSTDLPAGPLILGAAPSALKGMLPCILKKWMAIYPDINVLIEPGPSTPLYDRVQQGELDAAILVHPAFDIPKSLNWRLLRTERLILLTRSEMAGMNPFDIIRQAPFIRYDRRVVAGKMAADYLEAHQIRPHVRLELDGIDYIANLVEAGLGVSVLPDWADADRIAPTLLRHSLPEHVPTRNLGLLWQRASARERLVLAFLELAGP